jgi:hypothetical protein
VRRFADILMQAGIVTTTRKTRGDDIDAACGQLAGQVKDKTRRTAGRSCRSQSTPTRAIFRPTVFEAWFG